MSNSNEFIEAVKKGDRARVENLLKGQPDLVTAKDKNGVSAILVAKYYGEQEIAELLFENGADLDVFEAAALGKLARLQELVEKRPQLVNAIAADGFQPLGLASFFGQAEAAVYLVEQGAEVNAASQNAQKVMPLHSAVAREHLEIARMLLSHGANVNARQTNDFTPLHGAAQNGQVAMVRLLLEYGADVSASSASGKTALDLARTQGHEAVIDILMNA